MNRREMLGNLAAGAVALPLLHAGGAARAAVRGAAIEPAILARLGMTTVCLRDRIPTHPNQAIPQVTPPLALLDAPRFIRDTFGLTNVEVWNFQFASESDEYCRSLRASAERAGCRISNLQLDGPYDLSSHNPAVRAQSIAFVKDWMRRTALLGAPTMRTNIDSGDPSGPFEAEALVPVIRDIAEHGRGLGVKLLIENHIGHSRSIANVVKLLGMVKHDNVGGLLDWGNSDAATLDQRLSDFGLMFPYLSLVSAKGLHFDAAGQPVEYPFAPIVRATERAGYRGLYSIELYVEEDFPEPIGAAKSMIGVIANEIANNEKK